MNKRVWGLGALLVAVVVGSAGWYVGFGNKHSSVPAVLAAQKNILIYYPNQAARQITVEPASVQVNNQSHVVSLVARLDGTRLTVIQQPTPDNFSDIPQLFPTLLGKMNTYGELDTAAGKVTLTHPKELNGGQTAVMNQHGTLLFARPDRNLTNEQWRNFFDNLEIIK